MSSNEHVITLTLVIDDAAAMQAKVQALVSLLLTSYAHNAEMNAIHRPAEVLRITRFIPRLSFRSVVGQRRYLAQHTSAPDYAVLGAGITGLATAYYLRQKDPRCKVTIYEASDRIGGWVGSKRVSVPTGDVVFESGPRSLRPGGNGILSCRLVGQCRGSSYGSFTNTARRTS